MFWDWFKHKHWQFLNWQLLPITTIGWKSFQLEAHPHVPLTDRNILHKLLLNAMPLWCCLCLVPSLRQKELKVIFLCSAFNIMLSLSSQHSLDASLMTWFIISGNISNSWYYMAMPNPVSSNHCALFSWAIVLWTVGQSGSLVALAANSRGGRDCLVK